MKLAKWHEYDRKALKDFYSSPGHLWNWAEMESGANTPAKLAAEWIDANPLPKAFPVIIPRVTKALDGKLNLFWYAVGFNQAQAEQLRAELWAFVGPVGNDFNRRVAELAVHDQAENVLRVWSGGPWVYRLTVVDQTKKDWIRTALNRLRLIWANRPVGLPTRFRTSEELLRDFHSSLVNGDELSSERLLHELRDGGRLSAENLLFLQVESMATFARWNELLLHPQWSLLRQLRRPRLVTAHMIEAIYQVKICPFVRRNDVTGVVATVRDNVLPEDSVLFRTKGHAISPQILLSFFLIAAATASPDKERVRQLLHSIPESSAERQFANAVFLSLANWGSTSNETEVARAKRAIATNDYEAAWELLQTAPPTSDSVRIQIMCADEFDTIDSAQIVEKRLLSLVDAERTLVFNTKSIVRSWDEIQKRLGQRPPPSDWESWLERLDQESGWTEAASSAKNGAKEWTVDGYRGDPIRVNKLADSLFSDRIETAQRTLRTALPHLAVFFMPDNHGVSEFRPIYCSLLSLTTLTDDFSVEDFRFVETLLLAILEAGVTESVYVEAVQNCIAIWENHGSVYNIDWALEILDVLASRKSPQPTIRDAYFDAVLLTFQREHRRISPGQWQILSWLCHDLDRTASLNAILPTFSTTTDQQSQSQRLQDILKGQTVGIYTLTESAGDRAKAMIEKMFTDVKVQVNSDSVGTPVLKALARRADWFLVATRSAKHAATEFIKEMRPPESTELLYPSGKGASSIVSTLLRVLDSASN